MEAPRRPKAKPSPSRSKPQATGGLKVKCKEPATALDLTGGKGKRFFQLDTLENAVAALVGRGDSWLSGVVRESLAGANPVSVLMELQWENTYALTFRVTVASAQGKSGKMLLVVAKNHQEHTERLRGEIDAFNLLAPHCPAGILPVRAEGTLYLPLRKPLTGKGRQILAYVRAWPGQCVVAEFNARGQYVLVSPERRLLSRAESESYGASIALLLLQSFDALTRTGLGLQALRGTDVLCRFFRTGVAPALMHCSHVSRYRSVQAYVKGVLLWESEPGSGLYPMQSVAPEDFAAALREALGPELAIEAAKRLSATGGDVSVPEDYIERLRAAVLE